MYNIYIYNKTASKKYYFQMTIIEYVLQSTQGDLKNGDIDMWFPTSLCGVIDIQ